MKDTDSKILWAIYTTQQIKKKYSTHQYKKFFTNIDVRVSKFQSTSRTWYVGIYAK